MNRLLSRPFVALALLLCALDVPAQNKRSQTVRPLLGKLVVKVPREILPSEDYWIYVNSQIVSAPPHPPYTPPNGGVISFEEPHDVVRFVDTSGFLVSSEDGHLKNMRPGVGDQFFQTQTFQLAPGTYKVELMTRAIQKELPFAFATVQQTIEVGKTATLEFGSPKFTNESMFAFAATAAFTGTDHQVLEQVLARLTDVSKRYEQDPVVAPLEKVLNNLSYAPPSRPRTYVDFPESLGGGREIDSRQIGYIVDRLVRDYKFDDDDAVKRSADANPPFANLLTQQMADYNKRVEMFREIAKQLDAVKHK